MNIDPIEYLTVWVTRTPWWEIAIYYFLLAVLFGTLNKRLQRWRCESATDCRTWSKSIGDLYDVCSHIVSGIAGYVLWPILLPMTLIYTLAESSPSSWSIFKKKDSVPGARR